MTDEETMRINAIIIKDVTGEPLSSVRSPNAIRMIVRFLKMVNSGMDMYCTAFDPV
jgi:hypothetical protein